LKAGGAVEMKSPGNAIVFARFGKISQGHPFSIVAGKVAKITIEPLKAGLKAGESFTFGAKTFNAQGYPLTAPVKWKTDGGIGTIATDGTFLAKAVGKGQVIAVNGEVTSGVPVEVTHGPLADIIVDLQKSTLTAGESVSLKAQGVDAYGNRFTISPQWFLSASIGTVDQEKREFTPLHTGSGEILAKMGNIVHGAAIRVVPAPLARLQIQPAAVDVIAGKTVQFKVTGYDRFDNTVAVKPVFSIREPLGDLNANGTFKAKKAGSTVLEAKAGQLIGKSTVAVVPAEMKKVELLPKGPVKLTAGKAETFSVSGYDPFGNTVEAKVAWSMHPELGSIDSQGVFFPQKAGKTRLVATVDQIRTGKKLQVGTAVAVVAGEPTSIQIEPKTVGLTAGDETVFSATAFDQFLNKTEVALNWQIEPPALGNITQDGRFTAVTAQSGKVSARHGSVVGTAAVEVKPAEVAFLKIVPEKITAQAGEKVSLKAVMEDRFGNVAPGNVLWTLSDSSLGDITSDSQLVARKAGQGNVIAAAYNIVETAPLTVRKGPLHAIELKPETVTVASGSTVQFEASGFDLGGNPVASDFKWSVDESIGQIDNTGKFTGVKVGTGKVAVSHDNIGASAPITVTPGSPAAISLKPEAFTLQAGQDQLLSFEVHDAHGNLIPSPQVRWQIEHHLGTITEKNHFEARMAGRGEIRIRVGEASAQATVTVQTGPIHTVTIQPASVELRAGEQQGFTAKGYDSQGNPLDLEPVWLTSGGIGTINKAGNFKATSVGNGFVTVRMRDAVAVAQIKVSPGPVDRIAITPKTLELKAGDEATFSATAYDAYGNITSATISMSLKTKDAIGDFSAKGHFKALHTGKGDVVGAAGSVEGRGQLIVVPGDLAKIALFPEQITVQSGKTVQVKAIGKDAFGNERNIEPSFVLNPKSLGDIDATGLLTARKAESGRLRASANGVEAEVGVKIEPGLLNRLEIELPQKALRAGNTYPFEVIGYDRGDNMVPAKAQWAVSQNIGRIEKETGLFHARTAGSGLVVASVDGIETQKTIIVAPGALYSLFIEPNPVTIKSDTTQQFQISGVDKEKNPVPISKEAVEWDAVGENGVFEAPGLLRGTQMGMGKVVARSGKLLAESYVTVVPGKPEAINSRIRATYPTLPADGKSFSEIIVEVKDRYHNPVPGMQVTLVSSRQVDKVIQPGQTNKQGQARGRISASRAGQSVIRAVVNGTAFVDTAQITFE
jgi:hypothetical protein